MKKYLVDLYLPAAGKHYDVYLPAGKMIGEATLLLIRLVESLSDGNFKGSDNSVLINAENGIVYDRDTTVFDAGIRNSAKLIIV